MRVNERTGKGRGWGERNHPKPRWGKEDITPDKSLPLDGAPSEAGSAREADVRTWNGEAGWQARLRLQKKGPNKRGLAAWSALLAFLALGGVILRAVTAGDSDALPVAAGSLESFPANLDGESASVASEWIVGPLPEEVAHSFTQTSDPKERLRWCRDPERVTPLLARFPEQAVSEIPSSVVAMGSISAGLLSYERFAVTFANGESRLLSVVRTKEGTKVDWEAYARFSDALTLWNEEAKSLRKREALVDQSRRSLADAERLVAQQVAAMPKPPKGKVTAEQAQEAEKERLNQARRVKLAREKETAAREELAAVAAAQEALSDGSAETAVESSDEVRVFISATNYYNFRFSDDQVWRAYTLSSPDLEELVTAYVAPDSLSARILEEAVTMSQGHQRVTLQIRSRPEDAFRQQYEIERVLAIGWVEGEGDYETSWSTLRRRMKQAL